MRAIVKRAIFPVILAFVVAGPAFAAGKGGGGKPGGGGGVDHKAPQAVPIQLGTSGGNASNIANGYCASGTLGALLSDGAGKLFVLSNSHVLANDIDSSSGDTDVAAIGNGITQPGLVDTRCDQTAATWIASLISLSSIADVAPFSNVDAAVGEVISGTVRTDGAILEVGTISSTLLAASPRQAVKKSGRTTGLTRSTIDSINAEVTVQYDTEPGGVLFTRTYTGQILIRNRGSKFLNSGDSGSLMVEDVTSNPRPIGLLFAGSNAVAVANPAADVLEYLSTPGVIHGVVADGVSFVGAPSAGAAPSGPQGLGRALGAQQRNAAALRNVSRGVGHAISEENGQAVIKVLVEEITPDVQRAVPSQIDGVRVVVEAVGRLVAF